MYTTCFVVYYNSSEPCFQYKPPVFSILAPHAVRGRVLGVIASGVSLAGIGDQTAGAGARSSSSSSSSSRHTLGLQAARTHRFGRNSGPLSSRRGAQTALKCSYRSDKRDRDGRVALRVHDAEAETRKGLGPSDRQSLAISEGRVGNPL